MKAHCLRCQPRVKRYRALARSRLRLLHRLFAEDDESVMCIVLGYGSGDAVQVSRSLSQLALSSSYRDRRRMYLMGKLNDEEATIKRQSTFN
jgi:xanthine/CO dehydrogenase XdhC/CoxF family maturation factor